MINLQKMNMLKFWILIPEMMQKSTEIKLKQQILWKYFMKYLYHDFNKKFNKLFNPRYIWRS